MEVIFIIGVGGFLPGTKQIANVAALPGIVGVSINIVHIFKPVPIFLLSSNIQP